MARITVEDCLDNVDNRFQLVLAAGKRARQILTGAADPCVAWENDKATVVALREIAAGFVNGNGEQIKVQGEQDIESSIVGNTQPIQSAQENIATPIEAPVVPAANEVPVAPAVNEAAPVVNETPSQATESVNPEYPESSAPSSEGSV